MTFRPIAPRVTITAVEKSWERDERGTNSDGGWTLVISDCGHVARCAPHFAYKIGAKHNCSHCQEELEEKA